MNFDLRFYWRLFLRRLPAMMAIVIVCSAIGAVVAMRAPTTFRTEARLLVEDPQIPGELASSTVRTEASAAIEIIRQRLMTRANMLDIADEFDVFVNYSETSPDTVVSQMQQATDIRSRGGGRGGEPVVVTVSFRARSGQIAANVVNEYVTRIISANVELRTGRAEETLEFFEQEAERLSAELDLQSARITQFQSENADALPEDQPFRLSRLSLLQERVASAERERATLEDQRIRIIEIFDATGDVAAAGGVTMSPQQQELQRLERELANALLVFSEENPQVRLLQRRIEQLRGQLTDGVAGSDDGSADNSDQARATVLDVQLAQIDSQIANLDTVIADAREEIADLESAITSTPGNAIVLRSLERDYENVRSQYDSAVARLAEASTGERIEVSARGQRISVIEAANVPREPSSPNRPRIVAMGVAVGFGLAGALFALLEFLNGSIRRPAEITKALGITPLATIPFFESPRRKTVRRTVRIVSVVAILIGVPAALWAVDTYFMPLDLLANRILARIGIT
ncbi:lipopolysaccharide biosynthesis [Roseibacterium sp. SDUM158017]|uniref:GumC family protein n=1 Tax=Roseicyclus salinarum TaxID=3036773 RepID=UPI0024152184|nr:lipopolysaccharide biosynthesis [Roseibacterium sp. SDUM158017]MDG4649607.1 lipopolysaccharide biosynthesis [Roseibacterium sp. SDUM158017]